MIAIDTNVVVRFLVNDDATQGERARKLLMHSDVFVPITVLLETEWVLRSAYGLKPAEIRSLLTALLGLSRVVAEDPFRCERALQWYARGLDFADALHLASSVDQEALASFDTKLQRRASRAGALRVTPP